LATRAWRVLIIEDDEILSMALQGVLSRREIRLGRRTSGAVVQLLGWVGKPHDYEDILRALGRHYGL
jgi:hypothetical protein